MPLSVSKINRLKAGDKEHWEPLGGGCYLVVAKAPKNSKRFVGKTKIGTSPPKQYSVPLGVWGKDFTSPDEVMNKWNEMKSWGKENNCDVRKFYERLTLKKSDKTLKEVFEEFIEWKSGHIKTAKTTYKS